MGYLTNGLSFNTLRDANKHRLPHYTTCVNWTPAQWLQAIVGELGEYANIRKKYERGDIISEEFLPLAGKELADVQIYLDILAYKLGINLGQATKDKFNEVSKRVGSTIIIGDDDDWHHR